MNLVLFLIIPCFFTETQFKYIFIQRMITIAVCEQQTFVFSTEDSNFIGKKNHYILPRVLYILVSVQHCVGGDILIKLMIWERVDKQSYESFSY